MHLKTTKIDGLKRLTDETGILQHAKFSIIDRRKGYTIDDNARALIAALKFYQLFDDNEALDLARTYLTFLYHMQREDGRFHNLLGFDRRYGDVIGSEDSMGRTLWATGYTLASEAPTLMKSLAKEVFDNGLPSSIEFQSPRAKAFTLLGLTMYHREFKNDENLLKTIKHFADALINQYTAESDEEWCWFESYLTYSNPRLPQSLFEAYNVLGNEKYLEAAEASLNFLIKTSFSDNFFQPIGSNGWFKKGGEKAIYDQQPIEASCMVEAAVEAMSSTGNKAYLQVAKDSFEWYHGKNLKGLNVIDTDTFVCFDGITREGLNQNQGAESTISYFLAFSALKEVI
jgi:uncharacterized protein YyaL (SSP411 family)